MPVRLLAGLLALSWLPPLAASDAAAGPAFVERLGSTRTGWRLIEFVADVD